jgi:sugar phosphate isomerase/epimerase
MALSSLGLNGGEFPHWPVERICDLAVQLRAQFVELGVSRIAKEGIANVQNEFVSRKLMVHLNCATSELASAMGAARELSSPVIVVFDDAVERVDLGRAESLEAFRRTGIVLLEEPANAGIRIAMENSIIRMTRQPEDLLAIVAGVGHPRFGVNYDPDNYYNAGIEGFPYAYELVRPHILHIHAKDSARWIPHIHGEAKRVLHRAGGNVVCVPLGSGAVNWAGLADRLRADGYSGPVSLEPHNLPDEMVAGMVADAAFLRRIGLVN